MDIIIASGNPGKWREMEEIVALQGGRHLRVGRPDQEMPPVEETARSYLGNARKKAQAFAIKYNSPALGDDSGLAVDALGGAPGLYTARFGGPGLAPDERIALLLARLRDVPDARRGAHFVCALCLAWPHGAELTAHGYVYGRIAWQPAGSQGFGYDPIFLLSHLDRTMAELPPAEKHRLSHRGRAMAALLRRLKVYDMS